jgi:hypothetical protein
MGNFDSQLQHQTPHNPILKSHIFEGAKTAKYTSTQPGSRRTLVGEHQHNPLYCDEILKKSARSVIFCLPLLGACRRLAISKAYARRENRPIEWCRSVVFLCKESGMVIVTFCQWSDLVSLSTFTTTIGAIPRPT